MIEIYEVNYFVSNYLNPNVFFCFPRRSDKLHEYSRCWANQQINLQKEDILKTKTKNIKLINQKFHST